MQRREEKRLVVNVNFVFPAVRLFALLAQRRRKIDVKHDSNNNNIRNPEGEKKKCRHNVDLNRAKDESIFII